MIDFLRRHGDALMPAAVFAIGLAAILGAWGFQVIGGYVPCKLCLEQRIPYYVGLPVALAALAGASAGMSPRIVGVLMAVTAVIFAVGAYLAVYHAGVEWRWWEGPPDCAATGATVNSTQDLLNQLRGIRIVSCVDAPFRFLGLSFAGWNAVVSAMLVVGATYGALRGFPPLRPRRRGETDARSGYGSSSVSQ